MKISKSDLKPKLFSYLRKVSETGRELVITEHGKPVLKIIPISESEEDPLATTSHWNPLALSGKPRSPTNDSFGYA
jgi:prevent-host-death family protein